MFIILAPRSIFLSLKITYLTSMFIFLLKYHTYIYNLRKKKKKKETLHIFCISLDTNHYIGLLPPPPPPPTHTHKISVATSSAEQRLDWAHIWAASWQNVQNGMCAQRRLRSALASTQFDQSSLSAWAKLGSLAIHWVHCEGSDQTGRMPRLIWVFAGRTVILFVLSCRGSYFSYRQIKITTSSKVVNSRCNAPAIWTPAPVGPGIAGLKCRDLTPISPGSAEDVPGF